MNVRVSVLAGPLLALALAACPALAPIASAQAQGHSCCPPAGSEPPQESGQTAQDISACCPTGTAPVAMTVPELSLELVGLIAQPPVAPGVRRSFVWEAAGPSPPGSNGVSAVSSPRAPPFLA